MTTEEYAKSGIKGAFVSQQAIRKAIKKNKYHLLPGVKKIEKAGKFLVLTIEENQF